MRSRLAATAVALAVFSGTGLTELAGHGWAFGWKEQADACAEAVNDGYYTADLYDQCLDDYADSIKPSDEG